MVCWNRLYIDYLLSAYELTFAAEWGTLRRWTFGQKTSERVRALNHEFLSNSNPTLYRLYHLVLPKEFYLEAFASTFEDHDGVMETSQEATSSDRPLQQIQLADDLQGASFGARRTILTDEVITSEKGKKFHLVADCPGLRKATAVLSVIPLQEAKKTFHLCEHCTSNSNFRTPVRCTPGCNFRPTFMQHFCCNKCKEGTSTHGRFCQRVPPEAYKHTWQNFCTFEAEELYCT